jgi:hypothetical protein
MSGGSAHEWTAQGVPGGVIVAKPFAAAPIVTALATLMDQTSTPQAWRST